MPQIAAALHKRRGDISVSCWLSERASKHLAAFDMDGGGEAKKFRLPLSLPYQAILSNPRFPFLPEAAIKRLLRLKV